MRVQRVMRMDEMEELMQEFVAEAKAHLGEMETGLLQLESHPEDQTTINTVFRAAHSIKGTAGFFQLDNIVSLSHAIEALFGEIRDQKQPLTAPMMDCLLTALDRLKALIDDVKGTLQADVTECTDALRKFSLPQAARGMQNAWALWNELSETEAVEQSRTAAAAQDAAHSEPAAVQTAAAAAVLSQPVQNELPDTAPAPVSVGKSAKPSAPPDLSEDESIRVSVRLLNELLTMAGEMVLHRNQLLHIAQLFGRSVPQLDVVAKGIDELTTNLQKTVMQTRMQAVGHVFGKLPRLVRDLSRQLGKEVELSLQGSEVELDRSLIELLADPLVHLVRNAMDHGFESAERRKELGKPEVGTLSVHAYNQSGWVIIDIRDDGAGIDVSKIKRRALEKGLVAETELAAMNETALLNLVMLPGFSTVDKPNALSGRGVGMDVVRSNIEQLGGKVELFSEFGRGTLIRLTLPLTLAIISAFIVSVDGQPFIIPQKSVSELLLIEPGKKGSASVERVHKSVALRLRGGLLPLIRLKDILRKSKDEDWFDDFTSGEDMLRVLVVKAGQSAYGLAVDVVSDIEEVLAKPLSVLIGNCSLYSGVTVLGDGSIAMILDAENMQKQAGFDMPPQKAVLRTEQAAATCYEEQYMLLFSAAGGETLGIDLTMVARVEKIDASQLQKIGSKYYFTFQGRAIRVIWPEHYLPLHHAKAKLETLYIILPKLAKQSVGLVASALVDTVQTRIKLEPGGVDGPGIFGSALIQGRLVVLLNLHELFLQATPEYYRLPAPRTDAALGSTASKNQLRVLLAEDDPFFRKVISSYLESDGYWVITAENGQAALERLRAEPFDLVVSDIEMPVMNGLELVRAIRSDEALKRLPVVALTSMAGDTHREKGLRAGFDFYEYKLDRIRLLGRLRSIMQERLKVEGQ